MVEVAVTLKLEATAAPLESTPPRTILPGLTMSARKTSANSVVPDANSWVSVRKKLAESEKLSLS